MRFLHQALGFGIERRGRLIQNQDRRVLEHRARDRNTLALASGKPHALLPDNGVVALWQAFDEVMRIGEARRRDNFVEAFLHAAVSDIRADGVVEKESMLRDQADLGAQRGELKAAHIDLVHGDGAFLDIVKARDQIRDRGFAAAAHPDQRDHLAGADLKVDVAQHPFVTIAEADILQCDGVVARSQAEAIGRIGHLGRLVHHLEHALGRRQRRPGYCCWCESGS